MALLIDKDEIVSEVVTTKKGCKPVYVSIGHMVSLQTAVNIVRHCSRGRIPEPTLQAHIIATLAKHELTREQREA